MNASMTHRAGTLPAMTDIRDIKPIAPLPGGISWVNILFLGLCCLLVTILLWLAWNWWKNRKNDTKQTPHLLPHEQAFKDLDGLPANSDLADKPYYFRLSQILRAYLKARFRINALEMTTEELIPALKCAALSPKKIRDINVFCRSSDLVKYATNKVGATQRKTDHDLVRALIEQTAHRPETEEKKQEKTFTFDTSEHLLKK